ncbi:hypothetical protein [Haloferula rosea]|uniref:Uncharacterized protein n=1 Tax=Haloferula rosea TaxID=490093 RepID=A0A934R947_9BACT|nr:hypothetical protein [Haloferula rosea]MBK1826612.1 hypothetical protein [Haloferula rosea]
MKIPLLIVLVPYSLLYVLSGWAFHRRYEVDSLISMRDPDVLDRVAESGSTSEGWTEFLIETATGGAWLIQLLAAAMAALLVFYAWFRNPNEWTVECEVEDS